jgi:hypothetical protein
MRNTFKLLLIVSATAGAMAVTSCSKPAAPPPYDVSLDMKELMGHVVDPAAWAFWHASGEVETAKGIERLEPTTEAGWEAVENGAATVAEAGNLMLLPGRNRNEKAWTDWSVKLQKAGHEAKAAAEAKDPERMFTAGADMYSVCTGCHEVYVIPAAIKAAQGQPTKPLPGWPADVIRSQEHFKTEPAPAAPAKK